MATVSEESTENVRTFSDVLRVHAREREHAIAFDCGARTISYGALDRSARMTVRALMRSGVGRGDRIAYYGKSCVEYFELLAGALQLGAIMVPVNWRLAPSEVVQVFDDAGVAVVVTDGEFESRTIAVAREVDCIRLVVTLAPHGATVSWHDWRATGSTSEAPLPDLDGDDVALMIYTSGTTGKPKGVVMTHRALLAYATALSSVASMSAETVSLSTMPLFHIGGTGWALSAAFRGGTTIQMRQVDPDLMLRAVERHRVTTLIAVPVVVQMLLRSPLVATTDLTTLRTFYYGGGPMTESTLNEALSVFSCEFVQGFGMTECPLITSLSPVEHLGDPGLLRSCGRPVEHTEVRLIDPASGRDVSAGAVGEIVVRSPQLASGYWHQPDADAAAFLDGGWFRTGDAAYRDSEGRLYMQDRIKDMIVTGGENVYPAEVENVLASHPAVVECAVIGVPSERWTETVKAVVVARPGAGSEDELIAFCRQRLATYKCPTSVDFVEVLPRTPSGKLEKYRLRASVR